MSAKPSLRPPHRALLLAGAVAMASALTATGCGRDPAATAGPAAATAQAAAGAAVPAAAIRRLTALACRVAAGNADPHPAWITAVATTHARALTSATPGDSVPGSARERVYLITMHGSFTADDVPITPKAKAPTGQYVSMVVDASTFRGLDFGISPEPLKVWPASLGPVTYLTGC